MSNLINIQNGQATTTSKQIAENFGREHKNVLRDIENIQKDVLNSEPMFFETTLPDSYGRAQKAYIMNRDGFTLLAMGFTGSDALQWKIKYIQAFNEMEKKISNPSSSRISELEVKNKNAEARLKNAQTRQANFLLENLKKYKNILCAESVELLTTNAFEMIAGKNSLPRPKLAESKYYTATEIGEMVGKSSSAIGKLANANNLKTAEYGHMVLDKSKHSSKQIETFRYNEAGKNRLLELLRKSEAV